MGCSAGDTECQSDESPSHLVELPKGFRLGQTEVTTAAYHRVFPSAPFQDKDANLPAVNISWQQAKAYCAAVDGRLPAEAEWEYAARGGVSGAYYAVPANIAWYAANSGETRHAVAGKTPNAYGLYDVLGNASEWVLDRYYNKYDVEAPAIGKVDEPLAPNATAVTRGGYWDSNIRNIRVSRRAEMENDVPGPMAGIRCAIDRN
jgi:formylglycine-generating enzyme required for sulfatase activity